MTLRLMDGGDCREHGGISPGTILYDLRRAVRSHHVRHPCAHAREISRRVIGGPSAPPLRYHVFCGGHFAPPFAFAAFAAFAALSAAAFAVRTAATIAGASGPITSDFPPTLTPTDPAAIVRPPTL